VTVPTQIRHAYDFRKAVEGDAAFLAALNGSQPQINAIRLALEGLEKAVEQRTSSADVDFSFHLAITHASGNVWFTDALTAMHDQIETVIDIARKLSLGKSESHLRAVQHEHVAIFDAIIQKDPDRARDAMRSHLTNTCDRIFSGQSF
jgi:GntR family transcriptional regulator, transcriptional repressor for pyruvate dehydrogenase complex